MAKMKSSTCADQGTPDVRAPVTAAEHSVVEDGMFFPVDSVVTGGSQQPRFLFWKSDLLKIGSNAHIRTDICRSLQRCARVSKMRKWYTLCLSPATRLVEVKVEETNKKESPCKASNQDARVLLTVPAKAFVLVDASFSLETLLSSVLQKFFRFVHKSCLPGARFYQIPYHSGFRFY